MSLVPDELWRRIMEIGIETQTLDYRNLCSLSIACRRLHRLASEDSLWALLLPSDLPSSGEKLKRGDESTSSAVPSGKIKELYKIRYEKNREQKRLAHKRVVLRIESEISERLRKIRQIELQSSEETEKMNKTTAELLSLHKARQASSALNVWQPEVIRGRQKQLVQQSSVSVDFRVSALEMELSLCKKQISGFNKTLQMEKRRLHQAEEQLASVNYHPLAYLQSTTFQMNEHRVRRKKSKT